MFERNKNTTSINIGDNLECSGIKGGIIINGESFQGGSITVKGDKVYIDGKEAEGSYTSSKKIEITIQGDVEGNVRATSSDIKIEGNVGKKVETVSGDIECNDIHGDIDTVSGDIRCNNVEGDIDTVSGNVKRS